MKLPPTAISIGPPVPAAWPERIALADCISRFPPTASRTAQGPPEEKVGLEPFGIDPMLTEANEGRPSGGRR